MIIINDNNNKMMNRTLLKPKHSRALSAANKLFFFAAMLVSVATVAQPRTLVKSVDVNYTTKQVTINIAWAAGSRGTYDGKTYNSKVWVFVDYQPVTGLTTGAWQRATVDLSALPAGCTADGANAKGFWYQGQETAAQNANITVTLTNVPAKFNWCAYATDYPPNVATSNSGTYTFRGTAPFLINGTTTVNSTTYVGAAINTITDATGCPGCIAVRDMSTISGACCPGLTLVGGYCRNLTADGASTFTGCGIEIKSTDAGRIKSYSLNSPCPAGWRWPTQSELICMSKHCRTLGIPATEGALFHDYIMSTNTTASVVYYIGITAGCYYDYVRNEPWSIWNSSNGIAVRCVR